MILVTVLRSGKGLFAKSSFSKQNSKEAVGVSLDVALDIHLISTYI